MKLLHTSDWHLGHVLYNFDRTEEQTAMLMQMVEIVRKEQPDVFLLSGDVYHTAQHSSAVQAMFTNAIVKIHDAQPDMTIVITAGNHDSGSKHEIFRTPWQALHVYTVGNLNREDLDSHIIEVPEKGFVVAVPYANERSIPEGFFQQLLDRVQARNTRHLPVVLSAHTTVQGCDFKGHDHATEYTVGGIEALAIDEMGEGYDYLALGHIHHAQVVHSRRPNSDNHGAVVRYSGSPIAVSFDEAYPHSVSIVEIGAHQAAPVITPIEIRNPRPLVTLPAMGMKSWEEAKRLLEEYPADIPSYIRLNVEVEDFLPANAMAEAQALASGKACRVCYINAKRKTSPTTVERTFSIQEFQQEEPIDIVRQYAEDIGVPFDDEMAEMFAEAIRRLNEEERNE